MRRKAKGKRESTLESWAVRGARDRGIVVAKLTELTGVPDRIFFLPGGLPLIIEFKAEKEHPREGQEWYLKRLQECGYVAHYVDTKEKFLDLLRKYGAI